MADKLHPGLAALPGLADGFASVQAAWRFYANDALTLPRLVEPLHQAAQQWRQQTPAAVGLIVHDWSKVKYPKHTGKTDQTQLSNADDWGYELASALLVDGHTGDPVAPVELRLLTAQKVYSTRDPAPTRQAFRIDQVLPTMKALDRLSLGPVVHLIDREADSLAHYRDWHAAGHQFLVRADAERVVRWQDEEVSLAALGQRLQTQADGCRREVLYHGERALEHVTETTVVLDRPAWRHRRRGGQTINHRIAGPPLELRLIVSRVCNARGETVAVWYLLTNVAAAVAAAETVALWYYWRWRIESFFKLRKSAGQQLEQWQQETGAAIAKRLLVAAMACVVVWKLARAEGPAAEDLRRLLIRLSGRQMKWGKSYTAPALLAGLWVYLAMLETLEHYSVSELRAMKQYLYWDPDTS